MRPGGHPGISIPPVTAFGRQVAAGINLLLGGHAGYGGLVRIPPGQEQTILVDPRLSASSIVLLLPASAAAVPLCQSQWLEPANRLNGQVVIRHIPGTTGDLDCHWLALGQAAS